MGEGRGMAGEGSRRRPACRVDQELHRGAVPRHRETLDAWMHAIEHNGRPAARFVRTSAMRVAMAVAVALVACLWGEQGGEGWGTGQGGFRSDLRRVRSIGLCGSE